MKFSTKPWISSSLQELISIRNKLSLKFINQKDSQLRVEFHEKYKTYGDLNSNLMKETKQNCYARYFGSKWNNAKNTWKGTKTIISIKNT